MITIQGEYGGELRPVSERREADIDAVRDVIGDLVLYGSSDRYVVTVGGRRIEVTIRRSK